MAVVTTAKYVLPRILGPFYREFPDIGVTLSVGNRAQIVGRFEKVVLETLYREHPSSRMLGKRLGVSHTTIANKLRQHGLGKE